MTRIFAAAARNPVFANLLMVLLVAAGVSSVFKLRREMFPEFAFDVVSPVMKTTSAFPETHSSLFTIAWMIDVMSGVC